MIGERGQSQRQDELNSEWKILYEALISNVKTLKREDNHTSVTKRTLYIIKIVLGLSDIKEEDVYIDNLNSGGPR